MEIFLLVLAVLLAVGGLIGCIVPALPGPPIAWVGILFVQWAIHPYSTTFIVVTGIITLLVALFDYYLPIITAKKFGATKQGIWGSIIGMTLGIVFTPVGMIAGLIIGSIIGDLIAGQTMNQAARSASGTILGTLITIGVKLTWCCILAWFIMSRIFSYAFPSFSIFG
jgi:uncharacterized protein